MKTYMDWNVQDVRTALRSVYLHSLFMIQNFEYMYTMQYHARQFNAGLLNNLGRSHDLQVMLVIIWA